MDDGDDKKFSPAYSQQQQQRLSPPHFEEPYFFEPQQSAAAATGSSKSSQPTSREEIILGDQQGMTQTATYHEVDLAAEKRRKMLHDMEPFSLKPAGSASAAAESRGGTFGGDDVVVVVVVVARNAFHIIDAATCRFCFRLPLLLTC
jgi:hypothetical protein